MGFKSGLWPGQNISFRNFFSNHFLVTFAGWAGALSCWKMTYLHFSPGNNFWRLRSNPFSNIFWYSLAVIDCSHLISSPTPADKNAPQTHESTSSMLHSCWNALRVESLARSAMATFWGITAKFKSWFITTQNSLKPVWITVPIFHQKVQSVLNVFLR